MQARKSPKHWMPILRWWQVQPRQSENPDRKPIPTGLGRNCPSLSESQSMLMEEQDGFNLNPNLIRKGHSEFCKSVTSDDGGPGACMSGTTEPLHFLSHPSGQKKNSVILRMLKTNGTSPFMHRGDRKSATGPIAQSFHSAMRRMVIRSEPHKRALHLDKGAIFPLNAFFYQAIIRVSQSR